MNRSILSAIMVSLMLSGLDSIETKYDWEEIENEYNLISQKKSHLSRCERTRIISLWEGRIQRKI